MFENKTFSVSDYDDQDYMIKKYSLPISPICELPLYGVDKTYSNKTTVGFVNKSSLAMYAVGKATGSDYRRGCVLETLLAEDIANPKKGCVAALSEYGDVEAIASFVESEDGKTIIIQSIHTRLSAKDAESKTAVAGILNFAVDMNYESVMVAAYMEMGLTPDDWFIKKDEATIHPVKKELNQKVINVIEYERIYVGGAVADAGSTKDFENYCADAINEMNPNLIEMSL